MLALNNDLLTDLAPPVQVLQTCLAERMPAVQPHRVLEDLRAVETDKLLLGLLLLVDLGRGLPVEDLGELDSVALLEVEPLLELGELEIEGVDSGVFGEEGGVKI